MILSLQQLRDAASSLRRRNGFVASVALPDSRRLKATVRLRTKSDTTRMSLSRLCPIKSRCDHSTHGFDWLTLASFENVISGVRIGDRCQLGRVACFVYVPYLTDSYSRVGARFLRCIVYAVTRKELQRTDLNSGLLKGHDLNVLYDCDYNKMLIGENGFEVLESFVPVGMMAFDIGTQVTSMYEFRGAMSDPSAMRRCADSGVSVAANEAEFERRGEWRCASRDVIPDGCVKLGEWGEQLLVKDCFENEVVLVAPSDTVYIPMERHRMVHPEDADGRRVRVSLFSFRSAAYFTESSRTLSMLFGARMYSLDEYDSVSATVPYVAHIHAKRIWKPDVVLDKQY